MRAFYFFLTFFCLFLSGCAQRLEELETRLTDVDERIRIIENENGLPVGSDRQLLEGRRLADIKTQVAAMRNEVTVLKGKVEALEFENRTLADRNRQIEAELARAKDKMTDLQASPSAASGPESDYRRGLAYHQKGDFQRSRPVFLEFIEKYPKHSLGDNAIFWVGESYFVEKDFRKALVRFQDLIEKYPDSDKKCDAMDRQVQAFDALGMAKEAKAYADLRTQECRNQEKN